MQNISASRVKVFILISLLIIPLVSLLLYNLAKQRSDSTNQVSDDLFLLAKQAAATQEKYIESTKQLLTAVAQIPQIQDPKSKDCNLMLSKLLKQYKFYTNFGVIGLDGNLICSSVTLTEPVNLADRIFFQKAVEKHDFAIGGYRVGRVTGKDIISFGYPIIGLTGNVQNVLYTSIDLEWLSDLTTRTKFSEDSTVTVIDKKGVVLGTTSNFDKWAGKSMFSKSMLKTVLSEGDGFIEGEGIAGEPSYFAFTSLQGTEENIILLVEIPKNKIIGKIKSNFITGLAWLIGITVATYIVGLMFIPRFLTGKINMAKIDYQKEDSQELNKVASVLENMAQSIHNKSQKKPPQQIN